MKFCRIASGFVLTILIAASPDTAPAATFSVASDQTWQVTDSMSNVLGDARLVCLNASTPPGCFAGVPATVPPSVDYDYALPGWAADLTIVPGARWIWTPRTGVGASPLDKNSTPAGNQTYTFTTRFSFCGDPKSAEIWVAADNEATVKVNGFTEVSTASNAMFTSWTIPLNHLAVFDNVIEIVATNAADPMDCNGTYQCNPAGVVFGSNLEDLKNPWPQCSSNGAFYDIGMRETEMCFNGGSRERACYCGPNNPIQMIPIARWTNWSMCTTPPVVQPPRQACIDVDAAFTNGDRFGQDVGQTPGDTIFTVNGIRGSVEELHLPAGTVAFETAAVTPQSGPIPAVTLWYGFGRTALLADFSGLPFTPSRVTFRYLDLGGQSNIGVNGSAPAIMTTPLKPPVTLGGATLVAIPDPIAPGATVVPKTGKMEITGTVNELLVGGEELKIDDLCAIE